MNTLKRLLNRIFGTRFIISGSGMAGENILFIKFKKPIVYKTGEWNFKDRDCYNTNEKGGGSGKGLVKNTPHAG